jgi:hypothetical protein
MKWLRDISLNVSMYSANVIGIDRIRINTKGKIKNNIGINKLNTGDVILINERHCKNEDD